MNDVDYKAFIEAKKKKDLKSLERVYNLNKYDLRVKFAYADY